MKPIGRGLKHLRKKLGITQKHVSVLSGIELPDVKLLEGSLARTKEGFRPFERLAFHTYLKGIKVDKTTFMSLVLEKSDITKNQLVYVKLAPGIKKLQYELLEKQGRELRKQAERMLLIKSKRKNKSKKKK